MEPQTPAPDWRQVEDWQDGSVTSDGLRRVLMGWILPLVVNGLAWSIAYDHWRRHGQLPPLGLLALALCATLGLVLFFFALRNTLRYARQGQLYLRLAPFPARLGQRVRLSIALPAAYRSGELKLGLACRRATRGAERKMARLEELWQESRRVAPQLGAQGPLLACDFTLPGALPVSHWMLGDDCVEWVARLESADGRLDRSFVIPVLAGRSAAAEAATTAVPAPAQADVRLAEPYIARQGDTWVIDSRGQPGAARGRRAGLAFMAFGLLCFVFPGLWLTAARWGDTFEIALALGIGLILLLPTLVGLLLLAFGLHLAGKRLRTTLADGRIEVELRSWLWSARTRCAGAAVARIEPSATVRIQDFRRNDGIYALTAVLQDGRKCEIAWGLRDAESAAALAALLQQKVGAGGTLPQAGFTRRGHPGLGLVGAVLLPALALAACEYSLRHPEWDGQPDDTARLAWLAGVAGAPGYLAAWLGQDSGLRLPPDWLNRRWIAAARARLAAARSAPPGVAVATIPRRPPPVIDGRIAADEWRDALQLALAPAQLGSSVRLMSDGTRLYLAADVPADTTAEGFDQLRVWFHLELAPAFENERVFLGRHNDLAALRGLRHGHQGRQGRQGFNQRLPLSATQGATQLAGHRQYELALDLAETGLAPGVPFNLWIEIEGDPERHADGKFKARTTLGAAGSYRQPGWYRMAH